MALLPLEQCRWCKGRSLWLTNLAAAQSEQAELARSVDVRPCGFWAPDDSRKALVFAAFVLVEKLGNAEIARSVWRWVCWPRMGFAVMGGRGIEPNATLASAEVFDPVAFAWTALPQMPQAVINAAAVSLGSQLLVLGGDVSIAGPSTPALSRLTRSTQAQLSPMACPLTMCDVVLVQGHVILIGGMRVKEDAQHMEYCCSPSAFDLVTEQWRSLPAPPLPVDHGSALRVVGSRLVVAGGQRGWITSTNVAMAFDVDEFAWTTLPPMHWARKDAAAGVVDDKLILAGGQNRIPGQSSAQADFDAFAVPRDAIPPLHMGALITLDVVETFDPATNHGHGGWNVLPSMGQSRGIKAGRGGVAVVDEKLVVLGGYYQPGRDDSKPECLSSVEVFDTRTCTWSFLPSLSSYRIGAAVGAIGKQIIVAGGRPSMGMDIVNTAEGIKLDDDEPVWQQIPNMSMSRSLSACATMGLE